MSRNNGALAAWQQWAAQILTAHGLDPSKWGDEVMRKMIERAISTAAEPEAKDEPELDSPPFTPSVVDEFAARGFERVNRKSAEQEAKAAPCVLCNGLRVETVKVDNRGNYITRDCPLCVQ